MKHYLHSNDPLFDPATLGYLLHRGAIRDRNKRLRWQGIKSLGAEHSEWKESFRLIRTWTVQARVVNSSGEAAEEPLTH
jgi:hypothetical protein